MIEVVLRAVRVDVNSATPLLLLEEVGGVRVLPIFIGAPEAAAIAYALQQLDTPRPMTHDLLHDVIEILGGKLFAVEITEIRDGSFIAQLRLIVNGNERLVSARPSDAIAVALRSGAPILVNDDVMENEGREMSLDEVDEEDEVDDDEDDAPNEAELIEELRSFLDTISPEDFK
jgi:bifunctional DNase/RNase